MKISLEWLSDFLDVAPIRADLNGAVEKLTMRGLEVEAVQDLSKGLDKVIVAHLEERAKHPNSDRLSLCRVNTGKETLQIVCGAQNMKSGDKVVLSMIGAVLPNGLKIEKGKIRDMESFGMLCSEEELKFADTSEGIIVLPPDAPVGMPIAQYLGRNDVVLELKVTPNRGDALSHLGVAREFASIFGQQLKKNSGALAITEKAKVPVKIASDLCPQYHGRVIEGVKVAPSPDWLQKRLMAVGLRPINNVVDVTNYVLMERGQPLHAFDLAKLEGPEIIVRMAKEGENIPLLDGTEAKLTAKDLVIADRIKAVALAGVMGGGNSEVTDPTTSILLEAAQFAPGTVRGSAKRHDKHTDSSYRFEREVDSKGVMAAMDRATELLLKVAGVSGKTKVYKEASAYSGQGEARATGPNKSLALTSDYVNQFLGLKLSPKEILDCLLQAGFSGRAEGTKLEVQVPTFRADVEGKEDLCEEVLRIWGYEKIDAVVPALKFLPDPANAADARARAIEGLKYSLARLGMNEAVNFAFTSKDRAPKGVALSNPLSEELAVLRDSLISGLIENYERAVNYQVGDVRLFEVRPVFRADPTSQTGVKEEWHVAFLIAGRAFRSNLSSQDSVCDFFEARGIVETALDAIGCRGYRFSAGVAEGDAQLHPGQSAQILIGKGPCGFIGRMHPKLEAGFKMKQAVYLCEFSLERALETAKNDRKITAVSKFPKMPRDLSLLVSDTTVAEKIVQAVSKAGKPLLETVSVVDLYRGEKIPSGSHSLTLSLTFGDVSRTLEEAEVEASIQKILNTLKTDLNVTLRT